MHTVPSGGQGCGSFDGRRGSPAETGCADTAHHQGCPGREGFHRDARLRKRSEFLLVQEKGHRIHTAHFVLLFMQAPDGRRRVGVTVSSRVGKAVVRNRIKRVVREVFRRNREVFPPRSWVVVIAKQSAATVRFPEAVEEIVGVWKRLSRRSSG